MAKTVSFPRKLYYIARMITAFIGPPVARWSARPALPPFQTPACYAIGNGITLWQLPVGLVRVRNWHRELPPELAEVDDDLRFPVMMSNGSITEWLDCTAWLIDHPERRILVDTGESNRFGTQAYFAGVPRSLARAYPKIIDATGPTGAGLPQSLTTAGVPLDTIDLCVLTHTHSDHIGNLDQLDRSTPLLVSPEELAPIGRGGRLLAKLPQDGRVQRTLRNQPHEVFGKTMPLTDRKDVFVVSTPGHTVGHQSVIIDLDDRQIVIAGDAAFSDTQVQQRVVPGIVENRDLMQQTYAMLLRAQELKPTLNLFTHDSANQAKLLKFSGQQMACES